MAAIKIPGDSNYSHSRRRHKRYTSRLDEVNSQHNLYIAHRPPIRFEDLQRIPAAYGVIVGRGI
jgi:hypothetical protein